MRRQPLLSLFLALAIFVLCIYVLIYAQNIFKPLAIGGFIAIVLLPLKQKIEQLVKYPLLASLFALLTVIIPSTVIMVLLGRQVNAVLEDLPPIKKLFDKSVAKVNDVVGDWIGMPLSWNVQLNTEVSENYGEIANAVGLGMTKTGEALIFFLLIFISAIFFLWFSRNLKEFIIVQSGQNNRNTIFSTISELKGMLVHYISGILYVSLIMFVLNSLGLYIIGVDYAVLWGALAAILIIIPYIGTTIGGLLPILYVLSTGGEPITVLWIVLMYIGLQQIEGNFITPKIVGDAIKINPFVVIFAMLTGALIWGITGVILSLPITGMLRIILMNFDPLKPIGSLMSSNMQKRSFSIQNKFDEDQYRIASLFENKKEKKEDESN